MLNFRGVVGKYESSLAPPKLQGFPKTNSSKLYSSPLKINGLIRLTVHFWQVEKSCTTNLHKPILHRTGCWIKVGIIFIVLVFCINCQIKESLGPFNRCSSCRFKHVSLSRGEEVPPLHLSLSLPLLIHLFLCLKG